MKDSLSISRPLVEPRAEEAAEPLAITNGTHDAEISLTPVVGLGVRGDAAAGVISIKAGLPLPKTRRATVRHRDWHGRLDSNGGANAGPPYRVSSNTKRPAKS